ncbi:MAG: hypothetical protein R3C32_06835 [Chloroflexota bacterium]
MRDTYSTYEAKAKLSEICAGSRSGQSHPDLAARDAHRGGGVRPVPQQPATLEERVART